MQGVRSLYDLLRPLNNRRPTASDSNRWFSQGPASQRLLVGNIVVALFSTGIWAYVDHADTSSGSRIIDVPFTAFMDLEPPFSPDSVDKFSTCHIQKMVNATFLEDGEWVGYYSIFGPPMMVDPPMTGIYFETIPEDHEYSHLSLESFRVHARGTDSIGDFTLSGWMEKQTGNFEITKQYIGSHSWSWTGLMTPFGLVGMWGESADWFWLWKRAWTKKHI